MLNSICHISRYLSKDFMEILPITPGNKFYWDSIQFPENIFSVCWAFKLCPKCNRKFVAGGYYLCCFTALTNLTCLHFLVLSIQEKKMSCFWVWGKAFLFYNSLSCLFFNVEGKFKLPNLALLELAKIFTGIPQLFKLFIYLFIDYLSIYLFTYLFIYMQ